MGYGWVYRGTVGHEYGAMVPAALLGLTLCLASGRTDWHRRSAVAALFAAIGWSWGGSLSYMEQTFYVLSGSLPDVLYGYAVLFFLGALWTGCGCALLGMALTESRSHLETLMRPFVFVCGLYGAAFVYFLLNPDVFEAYETLTVIHFHDGDWLSATLTFIGAALYVIGRPRDRHGALLLLAGSTAWWIGYGLLTKLGGLRLAPLHRSESWGGVLGVLVVLILYLQRRNNQAALRLCLDGCVGGGLSFVVAVVVHGVLVLKPGPLAGVTLPIPAWRCAELIFGFLTGLCVAWCTFRLVRNRVTPPVEDSDRARLDVLAVLVLFVVLPWINVRRHTDRVLRTIPATDDLSFLGLPAGTWYAALGVVLSAAVVRMLWLYRRGDRSWVPASAFGKGLWIALLLIWSTASVQLLDEQPSRRSLLENLCVWLPAAVATWLLTGFAGRRTAQADGTAVPPESPVWSAGRRRLVLSAAAVAVGIPAAALLALGIQGDASVPRSRLRFGPNAWWRQTARLQGVWRVIGSAEQPGASTGPVDGLPFDRLEFTSRRKVYALSGSDRTADRHTWFLKNQFIWLHVVPDEGDTRPAVDIPIQFDQGKMYLAWPLPALQGRWLVLEREPDP